MNDSHPQPGDVYTAPVGRTREVISVETRSWMPNQVVYRNRHGRETYCDLDTFRRWVRENGAVKVEGQP